MGFVRGPSGRYTFFRETFLYQTISHPRAFPPFRKTGTEIETERRWSALHYRVSSPPENSLCTEGADVLDAFRPSGSIKSHLESCRE